MQIAVLLDLDNIKPKLQKIEEICQSYGTLVHRHAFSNTPAVLTAYGGAFREFGYRFELTPGLNPLPQEVDALIRLTAHELADNPALKIGMIAVVSNDNGYATLFNELRAKRIKTLAIGGKQLGFTLRGHADYVRELDEMLRPIYIGIDLGTSNTVMASASMALRDSQWTAAEIQVPVTNEIGSLVSSALIPSSVRISPGQTEVGGHVRAKAYALRDSTVLAWKHDMGRSEGGRPCGYNLTVGRILPEQAAAVVLEFCRRELLRRFQTIQGAVITHPASYESDAIEATRKAAVLAGWHEEEVVLLPEPHAALYDFLHRLERAEFAPPLDVSQPINLLVYDLGGGTLDVSLHRVQWDMAAGRFMIRDLAIGSRTRVGGDAVDTLIAEYILDHYPECWSLTPQEQKKLGYELRIYAEQFKRLWGAQYDQTSDKGSFSLPFQGNFLEGQLPIRLPVNAALMRHILEPLLCEDLDLARVHTMDIQYAFDASPFTDRFNSFIVPVLELFLKTRQSTGHMPTVDAVLLNGGMTYFPLVRERLQRLFGGTPILDQGHPDLAVARGAALYAAGIQGRSAQRVNPTNIYLEVSNAHQHVLRSLVAQGQTYPYRTRLQGFKLPNAKEGRLEFNVWVGMGSRPGHNTTLQRTRYIPLESVHAAQLQPGIPLDLEVEYTFDERLRLNLVATDGSGASFALEISGDESHAGERNGSHDLIPIIPRTRAGRAIIPEEQVSFEEWDKVTTELAVKWHDRDQWAKFRNLEARILIASNRLDYMQRLMNWLPDNPGQYKLRRRYQIMLTVRVLGALFQLFASQDAASAPLEADFERWIQKQYERSFTNFPDLLQYIGEIPGKLLWGQWDDRLMRAFQSYQHEARSQVFLNSFGKCASPTADNLRWLRQIIHGGEHIAQREKAAWALARLISPGQPSSRQADFREVEESTRLVLKQLCTIETEAQVVPNLVSCLYQCLAWKFVHKRFSLQISDSIDGLSADALAATPNLVRFPDIQKAVHQKLSVLPQMLEIDKASAEDKSLIKKYMLEVMEGS